MRHLTILLLYILTFVCIVFFFYRCQCVVKLLEALPTVGEEMRDKTSRCAFYLSLVFKLARQKSITRKCESRWLSVITVLCISGETNCQVFFTFTVGQEEGCPRIIQSNLFRTFTVETFNNGRYAGDACISAETAFTCQQLADSSYHDYSVYWNSTKSFSFIFLADLRLQSNM